MIKVTAALETDTAPSLCSPFGGLLQELSQMFPPDFIAARWHVIRDYLAFPPPPPPRYIGIIFINLWGSCGNLLLLSRVFPLLAYVCRVSRSTTAAVRRRGGGVVRIWVSPAARQTPTPTSCSPRVTASGVVWCYRGPPRRRRVSHEPRGSSVLAE